MLMVTRLDSHPDMQSIVTTGRGLDFRAPRVWRALIARPSKEQDAADNLKRNSIIAYWPNFRRRIAASAPPGGTLRQQHRLSAVIPGYLFMAVSLNSPDPWPVVDQTPGLTGFVRDGEGNAAGLTNGDIEIIRHIEAGLNLPEPAKVVHTFKIGQKVRFVDDLLRRWQAGKIGALADDGRIRVDTPGLLGRVVPIWAFPHQIEAM